MIVAFVSDPHLRAAVLQAAHPEEDAILDYELAEEALDSGFPRLVLLHPPDSYRVLDKDGQRRAPRIVTLDDARLAAWDSERKGQPGFRRRVDGLRDRLEPLLERRTEDATWVDRTLADLSRTAGRPLPPVLRAFARRVLEFPSHYDDIGPVAEACGMSRGALKARFRRRGLPSPYTYIRWLRMIACANLLADRRITVARAASRLGFTSDGNLCRAMGALTGQTPTELREVIGRHRLLVSFSWEYLHPDALEAWRDLEQLFVRVA